MDRCELPFTRRAGERHPKDESAEHPCPVRGDASRTEDTAHGPHPHHPALLPLYRYRHLVLSEELNVLENNAASRLLTAVPSLSPLPQGATLETLAAAARNQPLSPSQRKRIPPQPSRPAGGSPRLAAAAPDAEGALRQRVTSTEHRSRASSRRLFDGQAAASSEASARIAPRRNSRDPPPPDHGDDAARALEEQLRLWRTTALALAAVALGVCVGAALARRR